MKRLVLPIALAAALTAPAFAEDVTVTIAGVKAKGGNVLVSLQTEAEFMQPRGTYGAKVAAPAQDGTVTVTLHDVKPGTYSVSVLHDENSDMQMKMANGMPAEGWSMKNADQLRAAPTFAETSFTVATAPVSLNLQMVYP